MNLNNSGESLILTIAGIALIALIAGIVILIRKGIRWIKKHPAAGVKVIGALLLIAVAVTVFFVVRHHQDYKEWYSFRNAVTESNPNIRKPKLEMNNGLIVNVPWINIVFYIDDSFTFEDAENVFVDLLGKFSDELVDELARNLDQRIVDDTHIIFAVRQSIWGNWTSIFEFMSTDRELNIWHVERPMEKSFIDEYMYTRKDYRRAR